MVMKSRTQVRLILSFTAAASLAVTTLFAQNPPATPQGQGAAAQQQAAQGRGAAPAVGQIPIPVACTPEQIAAAKAPADPALLSICLAPFLPASLARQSPAAPGPTRLIARRRYANLA